MAKARFRPGPGQGINIPLTPAPATPSPATQALPVRLMRPFVLKHQPDSSFQNLRRIPRCFVNEQDSVETRTKPRSLFPQLSVSTFQ
jgi:hypothetical protein